MLFDQFGRPVEKQEPPRLIGFVPPVPRPKPELQGGFLVDAVAWKTIEVEEE